MEGMTSKCVVAIPCFNEELTISKVVTDFKEQIPYADIFVFDNNSTDKTAEKAREAGAEVISVRKRGKGHVVNSIFRKLDYDYYILVDGDDTYPPEAVKRMMSMIEKGHIDMVVGARVKDIGKQTFKRFHKFGNRLVRFLINKSFKASVKDVMSGYRVLTKRFAKNVVLSSGGFEVETEMTLQALNRNYEIEELEVSYKKRPQGSVSKINTFADGVKIIKTIILILRDYKPLLFFSILAGICVVFGLITGSVVIIEFIETRYITHVPLAIFSVGIILTGFILFVTGLIIGAINNRINELYKLMEQRIIEKWK